MNHQIAEKFISLNTSKEEDVITKVESLLDENRSRFFSIYFFGTIHLKDQTITFLKKHNISYLSLRGDKTKTDTFCGAQIFYIDSERSKLISQGDRIIGYRWESERLEHCRLTGISPNNLEGTGNDQTLTLFQAINETLNDFGFRITDIARTWLYLDQILAWYDEFNQARTLYFNQNDIFNNTVPASTGIGAANHFSAKITAGVIALKRKTSGKTLTNESEKPFHAVGSPLQCSALNYKSSFSRAVSFQENGANILLISGTASIEPGGKTVHLNDTKKQIDLTIDVIEAILREEKYSWNDLTRGIAYFQNRRDISLFKTYATQRKIDLSALSFFEADVCRDDLLFELEADFVK